MIVLTRRFSSVAVGGICVRVVGGEVVWGGGRCEGRFLTYRNGFRRGVGSVSPPAVVYVAVGRPRKLVVDGSVEIEDGIDLFSGFVKKGLWREVAPSFYATVTDYVSRRHFYTMKMAAAGRLAEASIRESGFYMAVERRGSMWEVIIAAAPGMGQRFKEAAFETFERADVVYRFSLGVPIDVPMDLFLSQRPGGSICSSPQRAVKPRVLTLATSTTP